MHWSYEAREPACKASAYLGLVCSGIVLLSECKLVTGAKVDENFTLNIFGCIKRVKTGRALVSQLSFKN